MSGDDLVSTLAQVMARRTQPLSLAALRITIEVFMARKIRRGNAPTLWRPMKDFAIDERQWPEFRYKNTSVQTSQRLDAEL